MHVDQLGYMTRVLIHSRPVPATELSATPRIMRDSLVIARIFWDCLTGSGEEIYGSIEEEDNILKIEAAVSG